ncbi:MAG: hypothetical protein HY665_00285 [Chloroflexi bacterium]|nr:hypothetical protein [Chloroflexota bacterium]
MEGLTSVLALIHVAMTVTAGVFLVARSAAISESAAGPSHRVAVLGTLMAFLAVSVGCVQNDLKKVTVHLTRS